MENTKITIQKNSVQETLIIPLYGRKMCTEQYPNLFQDKASAEIIEKLDYDFSTIDKKIRSYMGRFGVLEVAMRQSDLLMEIQSYLHTHPNASIVNLGCGLDQTGERFANGERHVYNLDFEDVIAVRNELIDEPEMVENIGVDLNDTSWFEQIEKENGVVFMAAGLFYYFRKEQMKKLLQAMEDYFVDCVLAFDTAGKSAVKLMIKSWVKQSEINDVNAYFYVNDLKDDLAPWLLRSQISAKGYMLGYNDLKDPSVSTSFRLLAKLGDGLMKMKIVKIHFQPKG